MAFFDIFAPVLSLFDDMIEPFTSTFIRLVFWAYIAAMISSVIFKRLSNPEKINALKIKLKAMQDQLNQHEGEFAELKDLAVNTIKLSMKRMVLTFIPALLASIPVIFLLTYLSNRYELHEPVVNEVVPININWEKLDANNTVSIFKRDELIKKENINSISWPEKNQILNLIDDTTNIEILIFPSPISRIIHKKKWWNNLIGNPAGYLAEDSSISSIEFNYQQQEIISFGPKWIRGWLFIFFFMTMIFSVAFIFIFKIKF
ncbi:MAG: hypothetical protein JKY19_03080 [Alcanivoracaceae bacterium]|nr:hypothetical protein [Alcanivoracaceae bacterium]